MWAALRYSISEAQLEILAAQRVLLVVLDQGIQAGEVQVSRQKIVSASLLRADANPTVLDPPTAPKTHQKERGRGCRFCFFRRTRNVKIPNWLESDRCYQKDRV